jgi:2-polyprenyl-3-methyl-5-hydroxy-6-metoxy-1,4-benzoquinol methylase
VVRRSIRSTARRVGAPWLRLLDRRFEGVAQRLEAHTVNLAKHHEAVVMHSIAGYQDSLNATRLELRAESEAVAEYVLAMARVEARILDRLESLRIESLPHLLADIDWPAADYINWLLSPSGLLAQGDCWMNWPVDLRVEPNSARVAGVNERIVETPHAHAALGTLARGSRIVDIGSCESVLALEMASMGFKVTALDPRPYPFRHPNLTVIESTTADWRGPDEPVNLITCISAVEHFGLGSYGLSESGLDADRRAMTTFAGWLAPQGRLVLTVPFGVASVDSHQRVYDSKSLEQLVEDYSELSRAVYRRGSSGVWMPAADGDSGTWSVDEPGVAIVLLAAR